MTDSNETRRKRVIFRSRHSGLKENDLLFGSFVDTQLATLTDAEVAWLEWLLMSHDDLDLNAWITGRKNYPQELDHPVMRRLLSFKFRP